ncbi:hypothetical protein HYALB_00001104 [Hymenoscyphus albidus]|uniref:37S ribosomal protein S25, mitochondrial n=1 Tax=Hymenoscyphus albidus TaxID=595503 RepID=A0A9N9LGY8_9HELO|nr:hypothetical protein HYALB_00001104 [Hymenoscyphus albidus]
MGVRNLKPARVYQMASALLETNSIHQTPAWFEAIGSIPPGEILTRTQPVRHRKGKEGSKSRKPSKMFKPQNIVYQEDSIRQQFYRDHPWELARPKVLLENDGKDGQRCNWSRIEQPGIPLSGESVVQRQLWLINEAQTPKAKAYDIARKEFYALRHQEEVERRVAREEATWVGAYFGKGVLEIGMGLEDRTYDSWMEWAKKNVATVERMRDAAYTTLPELEEEVSPPEGVVAAEEV